MYLKSLKITNFRKFGDKNNLVEFVGSRDISKKSENINIASSTTLIVGKNNSGKTTVTEALKKLLGKSGKFHANDFNFVYLNYLVEEYRSDQFECFPTLEFEIQVGIDFKSDGDLVTNIAPFMSIESVESKDQESFLKVTVKHEIKEIESFKEKVRVLISKYKDDPILFRKFLELITDTDRVSNYYDTEGELIAENKFRIRDLVDVTVINANKDIDDKSLSRTFNRIVNSRYESQKGVQDEFSSDIDEINEKMTSKVSESHTTSINKALSKIESSDRLEVRLSADLTFEKLMNNIIKYEYTEGKFHIPEGQFGLGYSNLMAIIGELIEYIEEYPKQEFHSKINLICIEEPEAFMHSQMQELFIKYINDAISYLLSDKKKDINSQLIITTHSSHILNSKIHSGNSFDNISYITIVDNLSNVVNLNDNDVTQDTGAEKKKLDDLKFLKKHIKYKVSELFFSDAVIFVEGATEETLLSYYIDQDKELNKFYISVFNITGAHALVYHPLIKLLQVPTLIITDLDIKRTDEEKKAYTQINDLKDKVTTNKTIAKYNSDKDKISSLKEYFEDENIYVVFQREAVEGFYATSFEEAFILVNYQNEVFNKVLSSIKPKIYNDIIGTEKDKNKLKQASYKLQRKLLADKSDFSNELLYEIVVSEDGVELPKLPKYINDGLKWLGLSVKKQIKGQIK